MSSPIGGDPGGEGSKDRHWLVSSIIIRSVEIELNYSVHIEVLRQIRSSLQVPNTDCVAEEGKTTESPMCQKRTSCPIN